MMNSVGRFLTSLSGPQALLLCLGVTVVMALAFLGALWIVLEIYCTLRRAQARRQQ